MRKYRSLIAIVLLVLGGSLLQFFINSVDSVFNSKLALGKFSIQSLELNYTSQKPVTLVMDVDGATAMRFGNTPEERALAHWEPYLAVKEWYLKTGPGVKTVYAEFRDSNNQIHPETASLNIGLVTNGFDRGYEGWHSYKYGEFAGYNTFYPATWAPTGGVNNSGYIWTDDSRWSIDTPEDPDSILVLLNYPSWSGMQPLDLRNAEVSMYLRGDNLDLKGAQMYFWIHSRARWHFTTNKLAISQGTWGKKITFSLPNDEAQWQKNYTRDDSLSSLDFTLAMTDSYGFSFMGFPADEKVTGRISIDEFEIQPIQ